MVSRLCNYPIVSRIRTGVINDDTTTISEVSGVDFPKHLTDEVCEYLVLG